MIKLLKFCLQEDIIYRQRFDWIGIINLEEVLMFECKSGNILIEDIEVLVNIVNCVGVMGCGIVLQFKKVFLENFKVYVQVCKEEKVKFGEMFVF